MKKIIISSLICLSLTGCNNDSQIHLQYYKLAEKELKAGTLDNLKKFNMFVNTHITDVKDYAQYKQSEYWASPQETLSSLKGDCEDIAILKYDFLKRQSWITPHKLGFLIYHSPHIENYHIVLTYTDHPDLPPLVLNNLDNRIKRLDTYRDVDIKFAFNQNNSWLITKDHKRGNPVKSFGPEKLKNALRNMNTAQ